MAPPPPPMGHGSSSENQFRSRRRSSASSTRSEHFAAAATSAFAVPTISVPTPTYSSHHRSSSSTSQHLSLPPFRHRRSSSSASQDGYRSPSPGSSGTSAFVLPPGVSISQITPNVFVGNNASSTSIQTLMHYGITSMVSLLSTAEQQLNEEAWNSPALEMLVPKQNRLFVRCEDSPEEDLMGKLAMICKFVEDQIEEGHPEQRHRKKSVEEMLKSVLPASEVPKGFHTGPADQEQQQKPKQRVRSLIPDDEGNVEGPTLTSPQNMNPKDTTESTKQKPRRNSIPAPRMQRVRSLIPDDIHPVPSVPSGSIPSIPSAPVPSLPGGPHLSPLLDTSSSQLSALSPAAQAGPLASASAATSIFTSMSTSTSTPTSPSTQSSFFETGGKVLIHCNQGVSRSGAACVAYIMKQQPNLSAREAVRFVQVRRKEVEPSATFLRQLGVWGEECKFDVWEEDVEIASDEGLDGKGAHGKPGHEIKKEENKVPKAPYKKWLDEREEMRRQVKAMGGLVLPQGGGGIQVWDAGSRKTTSRTTGTGIGGNGTGNGHAPRTWNGHAHAHGNGSGSGSGGDRHVHWAASPPPSLRPRRWGRSEVASRVPTPAPTSTTTLRPAPRSVLGSDPTPTPVPSGAHARADSGSGAGAGAESDTGFDTGSDTGADTGRDEGGSYVGDLLTRVGGLSLSRAQMEFLGRMNRYRGDNSNGTSIKPRSRTW